MHSARELFSIPKDVCYLNAAYMTPHPRAVSEACTAALNRRASPWEIIAPDFFEDVELLRGLFASILGCPADNIALVPAASYGVACAARNITVRPGQKLLVLAEQFPSNYYSWARLAEEKQAVLRVVDTPPDLDWTSSVLEQISKHKDAIAVAALPNHHWSNGAPLDLASISAALREVGAQVVLDVTQTLGACPIDLAALRPDFLISSGYKWLFCPYGISFLYVADQHFDGIPLEENWANRLGSDDFARLVEFTPEYEHGARRFDVGERARFETLPGAIAALRQILEWGIDEISSELDGRSVAIAEIFDGYGFTAPARNRRAPHFQGLKIPQGVDKPLVSEFAANNVFLSQRGDSLRVAPHLYNDENDLLTLECALRSVVQG